MMREWSEETQQEFASKVGKSYLTIAKVETGYRNIYLYTFLDWCQKNNIEVTIEKRKK